MRNGIKKITGFLESRNFLVFLSVSFTGYIVIEKTGLLAYSPASWREIFHSPYAKIWSVLFCVNALLGMISLFTKKRERRAGRAFLYLSVFMLTAALWVSINTRFEGRAVRAENQTFSAFKSDYIQQTLYMSEWSKLPEVGISMHKLHPEPYPGMKKMKKVTADISYSGRTTGGILEGSLSSSVPLISDWTFVRITDFGYAPKYVLYDLQEKALESRQMFMRLFPPGQEESFEMMFLGYTFYLKIYPDDARQQGVSSTVSADLKNPVYHVRVVRNKDIVYNGLLRPAERLRFDNYIIAIPEVRMWAEMSFVRDFGLSLLPLALLFFITGLGLIVARK